MAKIIIPSGNLYIHYDLVEITKSLAEWKGCKDVNPKEWVIDPNTKETRYRLEGSESIPREQLELICLEPFDVDNVLHYGDKLFNKCLKELSDKALMLADEKGIPYVAFTKDIFSLPRFSHHDRYHRIIPTTIYGQFYRERS